jgi:hypothetical protein
MITTLRTVIIVLAALFFASRDLPAQEPALDQKVALVIGNSDYSASPLLNPANDARDMADALRDNGFEVLEYENLPDLAEMKKAIRSFGGRILDGGVGLFYYAGHGLQVGGRNYLIPTQAEIYSEEEVEFESMDVGFVLAQMENAGNRMNIIILDACRNNPFARSWRSTSQGLAFIDAPTGTLIAYATAPGRVASDGTGDNGLYTEELLNQIGVEGQKIEDVFKQVRAAVVERSGGKQTPWESSSLIGDFYFVEPEAASQTGMITVEEEVLAAEAIPEEAPAAKQDTDDLEYRQKKMSGAGASAAANAKWKAANNKYTFYLDNRDITSETVNASCGDHLLIFHTAASRYYLFENFWGLQDNTYHEALALPNDAATLWMSRNNKYRIYHNGTDITRRTSIASYDEHKVIYDHELSQYYAIYHFEKFSNGYPVPLYPIYSTNGTLWRYDGKYYFLYVDGEQIGSRTFSNWSGNDLLVYDEQGAASYLLRDFYNSKDNLLRPAEIIANAGMITWSRKDNNYYLLRNAEQFSGKETTVADYCGNDLLVYEKPYQQTYLLQNWTTCNDGQLRNAVILFSPSGVFWRRSGNDFWIYRNGQTIDLKLTQQWNGNDLELTDEFLGITYILPNYAYSNDNVLRAAKIKN